MTLKGQINNPFINNTDIPKTVFKFRDWNKPFHKKLLEGEIYLSSPLDFNDPFDCNISVGYDQLQKNPALQQEYFTLVVNRHKPNFNAEQKVAEVKRLIEEGRFNDPVWLEWQSEDTRQRYGESLGVFCLTLHKDNILLWSHYANSHRGFNVGYNCEQFFYECLQHEMGGIYVNYDKEYPNIDPRTDLFLQSVQQTNTKSDLWCYEKEYRLTKLYAAKKTFKVSYECFKEINLGCGITKEHRKEIIDFVNVNITGLPVYQAKPVRNKFELIFEQIA